MKILALGHRKSVGKDTIGDLITRALICQIRVANRGVADEVKRESYNLFHSIGLEDQSFYDIHYQLKDVPLKCGLTPRQIWIKYAEGCREIDEAVWARRSLSMHKEVDLLIITDMRCTPEWDLFRQFDHMMIKVENINVPTSSDAIDHYLDDKEFHHTLHNDGTKSELKRLVISFINEHVIPWYNKNAGRPLSPVRIDG